MSEIATIHPQALTPVDPQAAVIAMIERAARDPSIDLDKMERLLAWREREQERVASQAFDRAMADCQKQMRQVTKDSDNPHTKSRYASYAALDRSLRPIYSGCGFHVEFDTREAPEPNIRVICRVAHDGGFSREYHIDMPADGKGAQGRDVMTRTHATGSALTYGRRYLLMMIFNIAVSDRDDDDGNSAGGNLTTISEEQVVRLTELIKKTAVKSAEANLLLFCEHFHIETLGALPANKFNEAVAALKAKEKKIGDA